MSWGRRRGLARGVVRQVAAFGSPAYGSRPIRAASFCISRRAIRGGPDGRRDAGRETDLRLDKIVARVRRSWASSSDCRTRCLCHRRSTRTVPRSRRHHNPVRRRNVAPPSSNRSDWIPPSRTCIGKNVVWAAKGLVASDAPRSPSPFVLAPRARSSRGLPRRIGREWWRARPRASPRTSCRAPLRSYDKRWPDWLVLLAQ